MTVELKISRAYKSSVVYFYFGGYITVCCVFFIYKKFHVQLGDLKGLFGLLMGIMQMLREKLKVLDVSYETGTGKLVWCSNFCWNYKTSAGVVLIVSFSTFQKHYSMYYSVLDFTNS